VPIERSLLAHLGIALSDRSLSHLHQPVEGDLLEWGRMGEGKIRAGCMNGRMELSRPLDA
jgi:hypothetical protein